jgi:hypothetical protein
MSIFVAIGVTVALILQWKNTNNILKDHEE